MEKTKLTILSRIAKHIELQSTDPNFMIVDNKTYDSFTHPDSEKLYLLFRSYNVLDTLVVPFAELKNYFEVKNYPELRSRLKRLQKDFQHTWLNYEFKPFSESNKIEAVCFLFKNIKGNKVVIHLDQN